MLIFIHGAELWKLATAEPGGQIVSIIGRNSAGNVMSKTGTKCSSCATDLGPMSGATTPGWSLTHAIASSRLSAVMLASVPVAGGA